MHKAAQNGKSYKMPHIDGTSPEEKKKLKTKMITDTPNLQTKPP